MIGKLEDFELKCKKCGSTDCTVELDQPGCDCCGAKCEIICTKCKAEETIY